MGKFNKIEWTAESIKEYLSDKDPERSPHYKELMHLANFIQEKKLTKIFDLGTWTGISGYIMATCSDSVEELISMDWGEQHSIAAYGEPKRDPSLYGMYLPEGSVYIQSDYRDKMDYALKEYNIDFAFIDDGHGTNAVWEQINICWNNNIKYIAIHDVSKKKVKRALKHCLSTNLYKEILTDIGSSPTQGIMILERING